MEKTMVKRGIGAVILAIIAALLLGYLLKDKSRERQEVVDMKLPGTPDMNLPSLSSANTPDIEAPTNNTTPSLINEPATNNNNDNLSNISNNIVASAKGAGNTMSQGIKETVQTLQENMSSDSNSTNDFLVRPPRSNETREITDNVNHTVTDSNASIAIVETNDTASEKVVASTPAPSKPEPKPKKTFKPEIIEEKPKRKPAVTQRPKPVVARSTSNTGNGAYAIQLLATSSELRARKLEQTMNSEGYNTFVTQTVKDGRVLFRVRIGGYADRNAAKDAQASMQRRYQKNSYVQNSLVIAN